MKSDHHIIANKIIPTWYADRARLVNEVVVALEEAYDRGRKDAANREQEKPEETTLQQVLEGTILNGNTRDILDRS